MDRFKYKVFMKSSEFMNNQKQDDKINCDKRWPCGELVESEGKIGIITDVINQDIVCEQHKATFDNEVKIFSYPFDYSNNTVTFVDDRNNVKVIVD